MPPEVLAVVSASCFAASHVLSKRGLQDTSVTAGFLVIVASAWVVVLAALMFDPPRAVSARTVTLFAVTGLVAPGLARATALAGVHALGPSVAVPLQQGLRPVLAVIGAVVILGESVSALQGLGVVAIVIGGALLFRRTNVPDVVEPGDVDAAVLSDHAEAGRRRRLADRIDPGVVYPIAAAVCYAASDLIAEHSLDGADADPGLGAVISIGAALVAWSLVHLVVPAVRRRFEVGRRVGWLAAAGISMGVAILSLFHALGVGDVAVVVPIVACQPLVVFLLSRLLLQDLERLRWATVTAGSLVVAGTILVSQ